MIIKTALLAGTCLFLGFSATPAAAETQIPAGAVKVDTKTDVTTDKVYNNKGELTATTTTTTTVDTYMYDPNKDKMMDKDEFVTYSYYVIDYNNDGKVDDTEWNSYTTFWYEPLEIEKDPKTMTFVSYDLDGDGYVDMTEYKQSYDADVFTAWDTDQSGMIDANEYRTVTTTYHDLDKDGIYDWVVTEKATQ